LLEDHDIEAFVGDDSIEGQGEAEYDISLGTPVFVSESFLDEATEIITDRDEQDDFITDELAGTSCDEDGDELDDLSPTSEEDELGIDESDVASLVEGLEVDDMDVAYTDEADEDNY
jgi:hypothetical protein